MPALTNDALLVAADLLGVQTLPTVLGVGPQQDSVAAFTAAQQHALTGLRDAGVVDRYDEVSDELAMALRILAQPERELIARIHTEDGTHRVCLARRGADHAVATKVGDGYEVHTVWASDAAETLARPILAALGPAEPAPIVHVSAASEALRERFDTARSASDFSQVLYTLGVPERDAIEFGLAMASCHAHAEIVAHTHDDGTTIRSSGAVAVYDTSRGRIVAAPGAAADQRVWSTFTPGTGHRIAQAISGLIESLPGGRWLP